MHILWNLRKKHRLLNGLKANVEVLLEASGYAVIIEILETLQKCPQFNYCQYSLILFDFRVNVGQFLEVSCLGPTQRNVKGVTFIAEKGNFEVSKSGLKDVIVVFEMLLGPSPLSDLTNSRKAHYQSPKSPQNSGSNMTNWFRNFFTDLFSLSLPVLLLRV